MTSYLLETTKLNKEIKNNSLLRSGFYIIK